MPTSRATDQVGRVLGGRYRLVAPLGRGASAQVYLADDVTLRRRVAVKVLHDALADDEAFLRRFRAEARAAAALNHPNLLAIYDWGEDRVPYLVTEYLGGGSLRALLDTGARLSPSQALSVALQAVRGLGYAHRRGFVHRDVKPANLLFGEEGRLRIADFGLARAIAEAAWTEPAGAVLGTARYASPEQARGAAVDGRADLYALGLVVIEAVTGSVPFSFDTTIATLMARVDTPVPVPPELGPLVPLLEELGQPDPTLRPDGESVEVALMATASELPRPARLPLAGALVVERSGGAGADDDTLVVRPPEPGAAPTGEPEPEGEGGAGEPADPFERDLLWAPGGAEASPEGGDPDTGDTPLSRRERRRLRRLERARARAERRAHRRGGTGGQRRLRRALAAVAVASLLAGGGVLAYLLLRTPTHEVPELAGLTIADARELVDELDLDVEEGGTTRVDGTTPGQIVEQDPAPGTVLAEGEAIRVTVSLGPTLVSVPPDLAGRAEADAVAALEAAGLVLGEVARPHDEEVPAGTVVSVQARPDAEGRLPRGSAVGLTVSAGPAPRTIPEGLPGLGVSTVRERLGELRLETTVVEEFSDDVEEGVVLRVEPGAGAQVERGATVQVVVSKGPELVPVPDVEGLSGTEAAARLEASGFAVSGIEGSPTGTVIATDPQPGTAVRPGAEVRLFTSR